MEHARKLVLVPRESVERVKTLLADKGFKSVQTPGTTTSRLDAEMNDILNSPLGNDEHEKWTKYRQVLQRYLHFKDNDKFNKNVNIEQGEEEEEEERIDENQPIEELEDRVDGELLKKVPYLYRPAAARLVRLLRLSNFIKWGADGSVTIGGVPITGANITELVNDATRNRKKAPPVGHEQFATVLGQAYIPREYIGNDRVWNTILNSLPRTNPILLQPAQQFADNTDAGTSITPKGGKRKLNSYEADNTRSNSSNSSFSSSTQKTPDTGGSKNKRRKRKNKKKKSIAPNKDESSSWRRLSGRFKV